MNTTQFLILLPFVGITISSGLFTQPGKVNFSRSNEIVNDTTPLINKNIKMVAGMELADPKSAFKANATFIGGNPLANNTESKVDFGGTVFDSNNDFSAAKDEFKAPADGVYHFDLRVSWLQFSAAGSVTLNIKSGRFGNVATSVQAASSSLAVFDSNFSTLLKLAAGETISVYLIQNSGAQQRYQQVQLSGYKVNCSVFPGPF
jgi:hypothetical protein